MSTGQAAAHALVPPHRVGHQERQQARPQREAQPRAAVLHVRGHSGAQRAAANAARAYAWTPTCAPTHASVRWGGNDAGLACVSAYACIRVR
eukprot:365013-Chlamydomonas_euryale.AAC.1